MKTRNIFTNEESSFLLGSADLITDVFSQTPTEVPELITQALHNLNPFSNVELLELDYLKDLDSKTILQKGMSLGDSYELKGSFVVLATAIQTREQTNVTNLKQLDDFAHKTLIFYAGFILEASRRFHVVLSGSSEMAIILLIADNLREELLMRIKSDNVTLATTNHSVSNPDVKETLSQLSYTPNAIYTDFDLSGADIESVKKSHGVIEDSCGAGASLAIASSNKITNQELLDALELIIYMA